MDKHRQLLIIKLIMTINFRMVFYSSYHTLLPINMVFSGLIKVQIRGGGLSVELVLILYTFIVIWNIYMRCVLIGWATTKTWCNFPKHGCHNLYIRIIFKRSSNIEIKERIFISILEYFILITLSCTTCSRQITQSFV